MAKVTLKGLSHSYLKTQSSDADWAIKVLLVIRGISYPVGKSKELV